jgi:hypothetical protein
MSLLRSIEDKLNNCTDYFSQINKERSLKVLKKGMQLSDVIFDTYDKAAGTSLFTFPCKKLKSGIEVINWVGVFGIVSYWRNGEKQGKPFLQVFSKACLSINVFAKMGLNLSAWGADSLKAKDIFVVEELGRKAAAIGNQFPLFQQLQSISVKSVLKNISLAGSIATVIGDFNSVYEARANLNQAVENKEKQKVIGQKAEEYSKACWSLATDGLELTATLAGHVFASTHPLLLALNVSSKGLSFYKAVVID